MVCVTTSSTRCYTLMMGPNSSAKPSVYGDSRSALLLARRSSRRSQNLRSTPASPPACALKWMSLARKISAHIPGNIKNASLKLCAICGWHFRGLDAS